ncbi:MAG: type II toxin-antitoxin system HicB family antitoxin [Candidatus Competibacteraceae bacterium]|nr:type II toxin-antitoxin system HicB family antitoxin [Candidatus Competibacteraceae bacterium]MCP5125887.1 type II toxin-antitoxin system HicB family antitoxin [Gammaproteobacteria bacterium]
MKFIIAIEPGDDTHAFGVVVPDLPGCFSAGDTLDEAVDQAREAIDFHCQALIEDGGTIPTAHNLTEHQADPEFAGWIWAVVEVPVERYFGPAEKINITLPRLLLARIDDHVRARGETRSGFLAEAARAAMR